MPFTKNYKHPKLITLPQFGDAQEGFLVVAGANEAIPFEMKRSFWTYGTPSLVSRGRHAHHNTEMVLLCLSGEIKLTTESYDGVLREFILNNQNQGVYIPPMTWHEMWYSKHAIQLVLASTYFNEEDYIRNYEDFNRIRQS